MPSKQHIVFVSTGTSMLTNCSRALNQLTESVEKAGFEEQLRQILANDHRLTPEQERVFIHFILTHFCRGMVRSSSGNWEIQPEGYPQLLNLKASAEIQSCVRFFKQRGWHTDAAPETVYLICTDTYKCEISAKIIKRFFEQNTIANKVIIERIPKLDVSSDYAVGIETLFDRLDQIREEWAEKVGKNADIFFNFTGGYKGIIPKLQRFADIHGFTIFYQYEMLDTIVELAPVNDELDILTNTYIHLKETQLLAASLSNQERKSVEELVEKGFFRKRSGNVYERTAEGRLAYESIKKVNLQIIKLFGFQMEFYFFELLHNEPLHPTWTEVRRSVVLDGGGTTREIDLTVGTPQHPEKMIGEVKSFLQVYDFDKPHSKLRRQLEGQLQIARGNNQRHSGNATEVFALFLYGHEDTAWHLLKRPLASIKQMVNLHEISTFRVFYFGVPYNSASQQDSPYRAFLNSKGTFKSASGRFLQVKEMKI